MSPHQRGLKGNESLPATESPKDPRREDAEKPRGSGLFKFNIQKNTPVSFVQKRN